MPNHKLLEVIRLLHPPQVKHLRLFLQSPYCNGAYNARQISELFELVVANGADEACPTLEKAQVSKHFFPEKPFREKEKNPIDSLSSDLFKLVRRFLTLEDAQTELGEDREHLAMARFYRKNSLEERFEQTVQTLRKVLETRKQKDSTYFFRRFQLEDEISAFQSTFNTYSDDANLINAHRNLDTFYAILKLEYACAFDFQRHLSQIETGEGNSLTQSLLEVFPTSQHLQIPINILYVQVLTLLENQDDDTAFAAFERLLEEFRAHIPVVKYRNLQAYYRYFLGRRYMKNRGDDIFQKLFDLYECHLREGYFYADGRLLPASLKLMVNIALKLGKAEWAQEFLLKYGPDQIGGTRFPAESHSLCVAEVHFYQKNYAKAQEYLIYRSFENVNYGILAEVLLVKIYTETQDELLEGRMKALEQKIRRANLSADSKAPYFNFLKKLDKVLKYGWEKNSVKKAKIAEEIRQVPAILEREWLLQKLVA